MRPFSVGSKQYRQTQHPARSLDRGQRLVRHAARGPPVSAHANFYSISGGMGLTLSWRALPRSPQVWSPAD
jgi:hypothetical protein